MPVSASRGLVLPDGAFPGDLTVFLDLAQSAGVVGSGPSACLRTQLTILKTALGGEFPKAGYGPHPDERCSPAPMQHGCGFKLVNHGVDTRSLAAYLGHRNLNNTSRCTKMSATRFDGFSRDECAPATVARGQALLQQGASSLRGDHSLSSSEQAGSGTQRTAAFVSFLPFRNR
jgi:hypothetical protein